MKLKGGTGDKVTREEAITILSYYDMGFYDINGFPIPAHKLAEACDMAIEALDREAADGCDGCKYVTKDEYEMPCLVCKRNHMDKWRPCE